MDKYQRWRNLPYTQPGIKQSTPSTCWCTALAWWGTALGGKRPKLNQDKIYEEYANLANEDNGMTFNSMVAIMSEDRWHAKAAFYKPGQTGYDTLCQVMLKGPALVGHAWSNGFGHYLILIAPSLSLAQHFMVMDPKYGAYRARNARDFTRGIFLGYPSA